MPQEGQIRKPVTAANAIVNAAGNASQTQAAPSVEYQDAAEGLDSVLDDIESVLENNAEDYVNHFVQKGGE
ncbi:prokaryotic ubiquitin-like protein Pup [Pseudoscardovia radai]|uniref:Prokaryotic ubiquitin-like protein Pup n=1 Tax=Pseudoscardovia radai TaxID=987066 RepID=A0A261EY05_9BIFI|nr:prokaryotic ubiquitin-like protein Pup [Pseudoscardovia radai]